MLIARASLQQRLVGPAHPGGERLAVLTVRGVVAKDPLDVVGQAGRRDLQPPQLAAERLVGTERAAEMDLEAFLPVDDRALQPDVGELETGAGVGQPLRLMVIGVSKSGSRRASSS